VCQSNPLSQELGYGPVKFASDEPANRRHLLCCVEGIPRIDAIPVPCNRNSVTGGNCLLALNLSVGKIDQEHLKAGMGRKKPDSHFTCIGASKPLLTIYVKAETLKMTTPYTGTGSSEH